MNHYEPAINELVLAHDNGTSYLGRFVGRLFPVGTSPIALPEAPFPVIAITHVRLADQRDWVTVADVDCGDDSVALCEPNLLRVVHPGTIQPVRRFDADNVTDLPHGHYVVDRGTA